MNHPKEATETTKQIVIEKNEMRNITLQHHEIYQIHIKEGVECNLFFLGEETDVTVEVFLEEKSKATISSFFQNGAIQFTGYLEGRESELVYSHSAIAKKDTKNAITIHHNESKTTSHIFCNGYSIDGATIIFDVNGHVNPHQEGCICTQDSKIIQKEASHSQIHPKLYIDNYDVEASHSAYLGPWQEEELFYLESRGMKRETAVKLLTKGLLLGKLTIDDATKGALTERIEKMDENTKE